MLVSFGQHPTDQLDSFEGMEFKDYKTGNYNTSFLPIHENEASLLVKVSERPMPDLLEAAEEIVDQLEEGWRNKLAPEPSQFEFSEVLADELDKHFILNQASRILYDTCLYNSSNDGQIGVQVLQIRGLKTKGHFCVFVFCVGENSIDLSTSSCLFSTFCLSSPAQNPSLSQAEEKLELERAEGEPPQEGRLLALLLEVVQGEGQTPFQFKQRGLTLLPVGGETGGPQGVFELPFLSLPLNEDSFSLLSSLSPWQILHRLQKDKRLLTGESLVLKVSGWGLGEGMAVAVGGGKEAPCLGDGQNNMTSDQTLNELMVNQMFNVKPEGSSTSKPNQWNSKTKVSEVLHFDALQRNLLEEAQDMVVDCLGGPDNDSEEQPDYELGFGGQE